MQLTSLSAVTQNQPFRPPGPPPVARAFAGGICPTLRRRSACPLRAVSGAPARSIWRTSSRARCARKAGTGFSRAGCECHAAKIAFAVDRNAIVFTQIVEFVLRGFGAIDVPLADRRYAAEDPHLVSGTGL